MNYLPKGVGLDLLLFTRCSYGCTTGATHRLAVDASGRALAPASLAPLVDAHEQRTLGRERPHRQPKGTLLTFRLDQLARLRTWW